MTGIDIRYPDKIFLLLNLVENTHQVVQLPVRVLLGWLVLSPPTVLFLAFTVLSLVVNVLALYLIHPSTSFLDPEYPS